MQTRKISVEQVTLQGRHGRSIEGRVVSLVLGDESRLFAFVADDDWSNRKIQWFRSTASLDKYLSFAEETQGIEAFYPENISQAIVSGINKLLGLAEYTLTNPEDLPLFNATLKLDGAAFGHGYLLTYQEGHHSQRNSRLVGKALNLMATGVDWTQLDMVYVTGVGTIDVTFGIDIKAIRDNTGVWHIQAYIGEDGEGEWKWFRSSEDFTHIIVLPHGATVFVEAYTDLTAQESGIIVAFAHACMATSGGKTSTGWVSKKHVTINQQEVTAYCTKPPGDLGEKVAPVWIISSDDLPKLVKQSGTIYTFAVLVEEVNHHERLVATFANMILVSGNKSKRLRWAYQSKNITDIYVYGGMFVLANYYIAQ